MCRDKQVNSQLKLKIKRKFNRICIEFPNNAKWEWKYTHRGMEWK